MDSLLYEEVVEERFEEPMGGVLEYEPHRECGDREAGLNWGVETFATLAYAPGAYAEEDNDRPLAAEQEALKTDSRALSKALRGRLDGRSS